MAKPSAILTGTDCEAPNEISLNEEIFPEIMRSLDMGISRNAQTIARSLEKEFVMQARKSLFLFAALIALGTTPAFSADSAMGRITYVYPDGHHIILDSRDEYTLASGVDASRLGVAQFVRLSLSGGQVTQVSPGPASLAGYWTGATARS
jgi:hypothetical protein